MHVRPPWSEPNESIWLRWWRQTPKDELITASGLPQKGEILSDAAALVLTGISALRGIGSVSPNPLVGCVILSHDRRFLADGAHLKYGGPHAEIDAIGKIDPTLLNGARVFVSLEPCAHHGKTPPCAEALAKLPISEVHYMVEDPNPVVSGRGIQILHSAGQRVTAHREMAEIGEEIAEVFLFNFRKHSLFVGIKAATDKNGIYAAADSSRLWITGERAREYGHFLRLRYDAILVGRRTVELDNPQLNVRSQKISGRTPQRLILDASGRLLQNWKSFQLFTDKDHPAILLVPEDAQPQDFPENNLIRLKISKDGRFDWGQVKNQLWERGLRSLLIEGGGETWQNALDQHAVQKIHWFCSHAPVKLPIRESQVRIWEIPPNLRTAVSSFKIGEDHYYELSIE